MQVPRVWGDRRHLGWGVGVVVVVVLVAAGAMHGPASVPTVAPAAADRVLAQVAPPTAIERADRARAARGDRAAAVRLAFHYVELGRKHADPRYHGRAQAVLAPWWREATPPDDVLFLRATIRQAIHDFAAARADLDLLIRRKPDDANARLTRSAVAGVMGDLATAAADCDAVADAGEIIVAACQAPLVRAGGDLGAAYSRLERAIGDGTASTGVAVWAWTSLGELARQRGDETAAERAFRAALALDAANTYAQAQLADLLLDGKRDTAAADLLRGAGEADNLLLRLAIAERRLGDPAAKVHTKVIRARLEAGLARGDYTHQREYGRLLLELVGDARGALAAALQNWELQKEPIDARLVIDASAAAGQPDAAKPVIRWHDDHRIQDAVIQRAIERWRARGAAR